MTVNRNSYFVVFHCSIYFICIFIADDTTPLFFKIALQYVAASVT